MFNYKDAREALRPNPNTSVVVACYTTAMARAGAIEKCAEDKVTCSQASDAQAGKTRRVLEEETTTRSERKSFHALTSSPFIQRCPRYLIQQVNNETHEKDDIGVPENITPLRATLPSSGIGHK
uniref:Uncharacterized protein n=1 Tax=Timema poppense TaxID=170557 RepID=A0A7R9DLJ3_TIMPO|nr:unnamed protein product [Timema poppensis]